MKLHKFVLNQDRELWKEQRPMDPTGSVSYTIFYLLQTFVRLGLQPIMPPYYERMIFFLNHVFLCEIFVLRSFPSGTFRPVSF